ncbi:helix-turn-helix transcriptional regulator [Streptomyces sp. XD-27]|uniref:helix-turn-helix domain-containing protein n=1 Tax=Streptomyces sp. XD-27 TaxID=3062779 RepID=UPI0026F420D8|nr:helix-turn-helix transcriptional regulator [Streptomyces sp. XD-27]WKX71912.1 helix-turn-helix transcriptional regulator [Streptomyces sp. XD-27]
MLAEELTRLRKKSGISVRELADKVGWDYSYLHRLETGRSLGGPEAIETLDTFYGTTPHLMILWELAKDRATFRDKYVRYLELEAEATAIEHYAGSAIPGILQTEAYARAWLWTVPHGPENTAELEGQLEARMGRQELLRRQPSVQLRAIIDEAGLRRPLLDTEEWHKQLSHVVEAASQPNVTVRVLPFSVGLHNVQGQSLILLMRPGGNTVAWLESFMGGELYEEPESVERLRLTYDALRDLALPPRDSVAFIEQLMEDSSPCDPPA